MQGRGTPPCCHAVAPRLPDLCDGSLPPWLACCSYSSSSASSTFSSSGRRARWGIVSRGAGASARLPVAAACPTSSGRLPTRLSSTARAAVSRRSATTRPTRRCARVPSPASRPSRSRPSRLPAPTCARSSSITCTPSSTTTSSSSWWRAWRASSSRWSGCTSRPAVPSCASASCGVRSHRSTALAPACSRWCSGTSARPPPSRCSSSPRSWAAGSSRPRACSWRTSSTRSRGPTPAFPTPSRSGSPGASSLPGASSASCGAAS